MSMMKVLVILCAVILVGSGEFCGNGDTYQHIYRVGKNTCPCTAENKGALRYQNNVLEICNGKDYVAVGGSKGELGTRDEPAESCRAILKENPDAKSGMYFLKKGSGGEKAYCYMDKLCGEKGWTMILKADGHKNTFSYDSLHWTTQDTIISGAAGGLSEEETKLHTYHTFAFDRLCIGMKTKQSTRWQKLHVAADSLYSLIKGDVYYPTEIGRKAWKELVPGSSLQRNCNKEGFNVRINDKKKFTRIRIGIISNQENECKSPDSRIGIGGAGSYCGQDNSNSVGNTAKCSPDNGNKNIKSFGYIFAAKAPKEGKLGTRFNPAASCEEIKEKRRNAKSGIYFVTIPHKISKMYCVMDACDSGGWSLVMKLDGKKSTFRYDSNYWKNKESYQVDAATGGLDKQEMKLDAYHLLSFHKICVGMKQRNDKIRWLTIPQRAESLYSLIADGKYRPTHLGRAAWKGLVKSPSLQPHCNKEGFNVNQLPASAARIGIISNQENECISPDSRIAFGGQGSFCGQNDKHSVGNEAYCGADKGNRAVTTFGYILVK